MFHLSINSCLKMVKSVLLPDQAFQGYNPFDDEVQHKEKTFLERRPFRINQVFWINIKHMLSIFMQILGGQILKYCQEDWD